MQYIATLTSGLFPWHNHTHIYGHMKRSFPKHYLQICSWHLLETYFREMVLIMFWKNRFNVLLTLMTKPKVSVHSMTDLETALKNHCSNWLASVSLCGQQYYEMMPSYAIECGICNFAFQVLIMIDHHMM